MATNVVELRTPQGREKLDELLESVTIRCTEDIHDAAVALARVAQERGMQIAVCDDISSKEPMVDAEGTVLNADIFRWLDDGARWWEDHRLALQGRNRDSGASAIWPDFSQQLHQHGQAERRPD